MSIESLPRASSTVFGKHPSNPEILTATINWDAWKGSIKMHTRMESVWQYFDPDAPERSYSELEEPKKPHVSSVRPGAPSLVDLGDEDFIELSVCVDKYWQRYHSWERLQDRIQAISTLIQFHVDHKFLLLIENEENPRAKMVILADACRPTRLEILQPEWEEIQMMARQPVI